VAVDIRWGQLDVRLGLLLDRQGVVVELIFNAAYRSGRRRSGAGAVDVIDWRIGSKEVARRIASNVDANRTFAVAEPRHIESLSGAIEEAARRNQFDLAGTMYFARSSGSTGAPTYAPIQRDAFGGFVDYCSQVFGLETGSVVAETSSLLGDLAVTNLLLTLAKAARWVDLSGPGHRLRLSGALRDVAVSHARMVPTVARVLSAERRRSSALPVPTMSRLLFGGESLPVGLVEELRSVVPNAEMINTYGSSQTGGFVSSFVVPRGVVTAMDTVSIGRARPGDEFLRWPPAEGHGSARELVVAGRRLPLGVIYLSDGRFVPWDRDEGGRRLVHTGDLVAGPLEAPVIRGRIDRRMKVRGAFVDLDDMERQIQEACRTSDALIVAHGEEVFAIVKPASAGAAGRAVKRMAKASGCPVARVIVLEAWPLLPSGKPDYQGLTALVLREVV
jgi:non-ribosomal peptide synthetase component F